MKQATKPGTIKPIEARAYTPSMLMRQVAERAQYQPRQIAMTSRVNNYRPLGE
jgi:hypothetical protein